MRNIIFYDGNCLLCNAWVNWLLRHDKTGIFYFAPLRSAIAQELLPEHLRLKAENSESVLYYRKPRFFGEKGSYFEKASAVLAIARDLGGWYSLIRVFMIFPRSIRNWCYDLIAKNRYRIWGKTAVCPIPEPKWESRFIGF